MRIFGAKGAVADLAVQFARVGARVQAVGLVDIGQEADVVADVLDDLAALAAIQVEFKTGVATGVVDPLDGGCPGAEIQAGRVVDPIGAALQGWLQAGLRNTAVTVVAGQCGIKGQLIVRLRLGCGSRFFGCVGQAGSHSCKGKSHCSGEGKRLGQVFHGDFLWSELLLRFKIQA
jgi:hypothetical protein